MTIAEIESTLQTLLIRHPNLDEGLLVTLLTASGWEDKVIKDAVVLFKSLPPKKPEELPKVNKIDLPKTESTVVNTNSAQQAHPKDVLVDVKKTETPVVQPSVTSPVLESNIQSTPKTEINLKEKPLQVPVIKPLTATIVEVPLSVTLQEKVEVIIPPKVPVVDVQQNVKLIPEEIVYIDSDGKEEDIVPEFNNIEVSEQQELPKENKIEVPVPVPVPVLEKTLPKIEVKPIVEVISKPAVIVKEKEVPKINASEFVYFDGTGNEERELKDFVDDGKELPKVTEDLIIPKLEEDKKTLSSPNNNDPQSLITPKTEIKSNAPPVEPPENLPMKPFESAPHVWPFSKYKEVFHGKVMPILSSKEQELVDEQKLKKEENSELNQNHKNVSIKLKRTGFDGEDEGLILMTGVTLLIILLLLAYMYSNGRL